MGSNTALARYVDSCVVQVPTGRVRGGSGFLVAPGKVLTCAHVLGPKNGSGHAITDRAEICWNGGFYAGSVRMVPSENSGKTLWDFPDLALISLDWPPEAHPYVPLSNELPDDHSLLYATGFKDIYGWDESELGGVWVNYDAPLSSSTNSWLALAEGEFAAGMSGGPILDPERGAICGILTTARKLGFPHGGLGTPATAIRSSFPEVWATEPPVEPRWSRLRAAVLPRERLIAEALRELRPYLRFIQMRCHDLYDRVFDGLRPLPDEPILTAEDLIREVADSLLPSEGPSPLDRLRKEVVASGPGFSSADRYGAEPSGKGGGIASSTDARTALIQIRLSTAGSDDQKLLPSIWTYRDVRRPPSMVYCDDKPSTIERIRERIRPVISKALQELVESGPGGAASEVEDVVLEFALPFDFLCKQEGAVDEWYLDKPFKKLGTQFPVVLRISDRSQDALLQCRRRWRTLQCQEPVAEWVSCRDTGDIGQFYAKFQNVADHTVLMLPHQPADPPGQFVLEAACEAGLPALVWHRRPCPEHLHGRPGVGSALLEHSNGDGDDLLAHPCTGDRLHEALKKWLANRSMRGLPRIVRELRAEAQAHGEGTEHHGRGLTLLWEDPTRPDPDSAVLAGPQGGLA
ncbi:trypsin-like peptidase domain-containing protein [Actinomadura decatromicini]|uniref:Trypsin-like peptidase domain-containing protein n=1 Tax=Actinomadura decatromicini TaxID=2604572 RepID=A0A5D3FYN0_9ACTN|nr:trypsin-like peptidase domain-containing protein [Actinomadura decatromicini]TYK53128.1 trypsin-like peptidase domain-containing protein [Actinomadura decatromicini]